MNLFERFRKKKPKESRSTVSICMGAGFTDFLRTNYTRVSEHSEIQAAVSYVSDIIGVMPIHLLNNTKSGDERIINELSRKIDISPSKYMVRKQLIAKIVSDMLLFGNSFILPHYDGQILTDLEPLPFHNVEMIPNASGYGYKLQVGNRIFEHDEILHFVHRPNATYPWKGNGIELSVKQILNVIDQSRATAQSLAESPTPSVIINYEGESEQMTTKEGRNKIESQFMEQIENGKPWMIPAELIKVTELKPLTLEDLAIADNIKLSKQSICSILGVPAFVLGVGTYSQNEYNSFIRSYVLPIARAIEQELTKKLLINPNWYFRFNSRSMYSYSRSETASVVSAMVDRAIITRNEARHELGYMPKEGLDELAILENYIPFAKIGDQKKLQGGGE